MNEEMYQAITAKARERRKDLHATKSQDYADQEDIFGNFDRVSAAAKILGIDVHSPLGNMQFLLLMKLDRMINLTRHGFIAKNESIFGTIDDIITYTELYEGKVREIADISVSGEERMMQDDIYPLAIKSLDIRKVSS